MKFSCHSLIESNAASLKRLGFATLDGKGDNGKFLDGSGKGVKEFDQFCSGFDAIK